MANEIVAPQQLTKQPSERRQYTMDFSNLMDTADTISSITSVTSELVGGGTSDLTIDTTAISGQTITMWISGGTNAQRYKIEVRIVLANTSILEGDGILKVRD